MGVENLALKECIKDERGIGKQRINLTNLGKWMAEQRLGGIVRGQKVLRATKNRKLLRAIIIHAL